MKVKWIGPHPAPPSAPPDLQRRFVHRNPPPASSAPHRPPGLLYPYTERKRRWREEGTLAEDQLRSAAWSVAGLLLALVALAMLTLGCVNPNRNNPDQYDACDFLSHMELTKLGLHDCETWKERDDGAGR